MSIFDGTADGDNFSGGTESDTFNLADGGEDTASGGSGADIFNLGAALSAGDRLDGGSGLDTLNLDGDYSAGLVLEAGTITGFEQLHLAAGHSYALTFAAGNVDAAGMTISGGSAADSLSVDNSAAPAGSRLTVSTQTSVDFVGGAANESLNIKASTAHAVASLSSGTGGVTLAGAFLPGYSFSASGGTADGLTTLVIGLSAGKVNLTGAKLSGFDYIGLTGDNAYQLKIANDVTTLGQQLEVSINAHADGSLVDASKVHDGYLSFTSAENCTMIGGRGNDHFSLISGFEVSIGGAGADSYDVENGGGAIIYSRLSDTTKAHPDRIFLGGAVTIDLSTIDADSSQAGDQAFTLVDHFDHQAGEVCLVYKSKTDMTNVMLDVDGDGKADAMIQFHGDHSDFTDFVL